MHESILVYRQHRYLKLGLAVMIAAALVYAWHDPLEGPNGGTWYGYTLGGVATFLILWLMWFGMRKRSYQSATGTVEGWLSAHVYLGISLIVIATLHAGFQVGWNVHTLAYVLMLLVVVSGIFGVVAYRRYPRLMTRNRQGKSLLTRLGEIADLDQECRLAAAELSDDINRIVQDSCERTRIGGSIWLQLAGRDPRCATAAACRTVAEYTQYTDAAHAVAARRLLTLLNRKKELVDRTRKDVQYHALMDAWLFLHVPLSFGLLAALIAHVVAVFFYW